MARIELQQQNIVVRFTQNTHTGFTEEVHFGLLTWNTKEKFIEIGLIIRYLDDNDQEKIRPFTCFLTATNAAFVNPETGDVFKDANGVPLTEKDLQVHDYKGEYNFYVDAANSGIPISTLIEQAITKGYHKLKQI